MAQHIPKGKPHKNEQTAIRYLVEKLPVEYGVFSNIELAVPGRPGQTYEHDVIVVSPHMIFSVELKSWGGAIDAGRDRWVLDDGSLKTSPITLQQHKARVLKSSLSGRHHSLRGRHLWVQALVFVTRRDAQPTVDPGYEAFVCTYADIIEVLCNPAYWRQESRFTREQLKEISNFLHGGNPRQARQRFNNFKLIERLPVGERTPYEAWRGERLGQPRTLHVYGIDGGSVKAERRLRDRALREVALQERLRNGPDLLTYYDLDKVVDGPEPAYILNFEDVGRLMPVMQWVRQHTPTLDARLEVARRVAVALRFMHTKRIVHRRLSPDAVLVTHEPFPQAVRLCAVELARDLTEQIATVSSAVLDDPSYRYMAPEQVHSGEATERSDLFALGATLFELLNGRPLFDKADDVLRPYSVPPLHVGEVAVPDGVALAVAYLLDRDPTSRTSLDALIGELSPIRPVEPALSDARGPRLASGAQVMHYTLGVQLREGPVTVWRAEHRLEGSKVVLKVGPAGDESIQREVDALTPLHHPNVVRYRDFCPVDETRVMLVVDAIDGVDGAVHAGAGDAIDAPVLGVIGKGLFAGLGALHAQGRLHRDVKPENVLLTDGSFRPMLIDFGLSVPVADPGQLVPGTPQYKDPWLYEIGRWEVRDDLFSAWLTLYEITTGVHPFGRQPAIDAPLVLRAGDFADSMPEDVCTRLLALFARALGAPPGRPLDAAEASHALDEALRTQTPEFALPGTSATIRPVLDIALKAGVQPNTPIEALGFGVRAFRALNALGVRVAVQVQRITPEMLRGLRNVGRKTIAEITAVKAALDAALGQFTQTEQKTQVQVQPPAPPMAPDLVQDARPLSELGRALTAKLRDHFVDLGVSTVGELATLPESLLVELEGVGHKRLQNIKLALRRLAGTDGPPTDLDALHALFKAELGNRFASLDALYGLTTGEAMSADEAAAAIGKSRRHVYSAVELTELRHDASVARFLVDAMEAALPSCGFATLEAAADHLQTQLAVSATPNGAHPLGYARLAAMLLRPCVAADAPRATHAHMAVDFVFRPPWQAEFIQQLLRDLTMLVADEPTPYADAQAAVLAAARKLGMTAALQRFGAEGSALLDALLVLDNDLCRTPRDECLYQPPIEFADAVIFLADQIALPTTRAELVERVRATFEGDLEIDDDAFAAALALLEWCEHEDGYIAGADYAPLPPVEEVHTDVALPEVRATEEGDLDLSMLAQVLQTGGFRVVALPAATHHRQCEAVAKALNGRVVDVDRVIIESLRAAEMWDAALFYETDIGPNGGPDYSWAHDDLIAALDAAVLTDARRGTVTVLGRPCLLGPLDLTRWVEGLYERARGGRYGLILFAPPADIQGGRLKVNQKYPVSYTPDMAAPVVRATQAPFAAPLQGELR